MSRKLWVLNLLLVALIATVCWQIRIRWQQREAAQNRFLAQAPKAEAAPVLVLPPVPGQVSPATYIQVANELMFSRDRNPTVVIEEPPKKQMPALPRYYGAMNFGSGPRVVLAPAAGKPQKTFQLGDQIGDFKLLAVSNSEIVFEWDGKKVPAKLADLKDLTPPPEAAPAAQAAAANEPERPASKIKAMAATTIQDTSKPGAQLGEKYRECQPGDKSPAGAVVDGYKKMVYKTVFGESCRWEKVQ